MLLLLKRATRSISAKLSSPGRTLCSKSSPSTIFALSSGVGKCGVSVVRVSGPQSSSALRVLTRATAPFPEARKASLRTLVDPASGEVIDHALALWFPAPSSFTGEDCVEFHVHGSVAVVNALTAALSRMDGLRHALAGEFTKRAFYSGKLDLTQVEGLSDLLNAETDAQRKQALRQAGGQVGRVFVEWRQRLVRILANVEAYIDFAESEDIEDNVMSAVHVDVTNLLREMLVHVSDVRCGERLRSGVRVAIIGLPNVGKSTLLNILAQRPAAIVSDIAGTTRDAIETSLDLGGYPVIVVDTAGLRQRTQDDIEAEGIRRAIQHAIEADLLVFVLDAQELNSRAVDSSRALDEVIQDRLREFGLEQTTSKRLVLINKMDKFAGVAQFKPLAAQSNDIVFLSCKTNEGVEGALQALQREVKQLCHTELGEDPLLIRLRHRVHVEKACRHLESYLSYSDNDLAIACSLLRNAAREIGFMTGKVSAEHILDVIFADFCIGK